jgi:DNA-binding NtrC family response regulator
MSAKVVPERVLIVCDDLSVQAFFEEVLGKTGVGVELMSAGPEALSRLERESFDLVIMDCDMPGLDSGSFRTRVRAVSPSARCLAFRATDAADSAGVATRRTAGEYLPRPTHDEGLPEVREGPLGHCHPARQVEDLQGPVGVRSDFTHIIGESPPMQHLFHLIRRVAGTTSTVLIQGETGTGKELVAKAIHLHSPRQHRPFVAVNCGAMSESLLESELFGHVRGAFTGAVSTTRGLFQEAHEGTLLLDEIGNSTLAFQAKLLRVLQEGEVRPIGSDRNVKVDMRVIASTNHDLTQAVAAKTFRQDLYYRLAVVPIVLPPLRQRREDIALLVEHFLRRYGHQHRLTSKRVSAKALQWLVNAPWPGNVRELEHVLERAMILSRGMVIQPEDLAFPGLEGAPPPAGAVRTQTPLVAAEQAALRQALQDYGGDKRAAARALGLALSTLYAKLKKDAQQSPRGCGGSLAPNAREAGARQERLLPRAHLGGLPADPSRAG